MDTDYHCVQEDPPSPAAGDWHARSTGAICLMAGEVTNPFLPPSPITAAVVALLW